ncbi:T9SS type A sorting domain-containing protein [Hymenobacter cellulosivorans]|uniref:Family 16 glycosylhydrolase n=1 Tax=Hymenobacter cellulosivorans TaxID=2932249 RepID=A0ABY4FCF6_9BACT|nr:T9SS type A sorting domain-containing protein [Hymenobacter cellulosivorans]UOQ52151.1 family 16 glycosylhydrolase [Hymenobacter cellulosivorans]
MPLAVVLGGVSTTGAVAQCRLNFDNSQWEEIIRDDFDNPVLTNKLWQNKSDDPDIYGGWGSEWYDTSDPSLVTMQNGIVSLKAKRWRDSNGTPINLVHGARTVRYRSGMLFSRKYDPQTNPDGPFMVTDSFGAWEARIKIPANGRAWPAFWLWSCPTEIDVLDGVGSAGMLSNVIDNRQSSAKPNGLPCGLNAGAPNLPHCGAWAKPWSPSLLSDDFHLYSLVWTPDQVTIFLDGREVRTVPKSAVFTVGSVKNQNGQITEQFYNDVRLTLQMFESNDNGDDPNEYQMDIDYVRVLKPKAKDGYGQRIYSVPTSSYKTDHEFINHDITVNALPKVSSEAASIVPNPNNANQVFYRGLDNQMYVATNSGAGAWSVQALPSVFGVGVAGDVTYHAGLNYVLYKGTDYNVHAYYYANGWRHRQITTEAGNLRVATGQGSIATRTSTNQIFYVGMDQQLHYWSAGTGVSTIPNSEGAFAYVHSNLLVDQTVGHIFYRGADSRIQYYWINNGSYQHGFVDSYWSTTAYNVSGEPRSMALTSTGIYYIGQADNELHHFAYSAASNGWVHSYLPTNVGPTGYPNASKAHGGINVNPDETRITYLGYDGRIQGMYKNSGVWYHSWLDGYWNTGEFLSFDNTMAGHSSVVSTGNLTAYYCGRDNHLRYFVYEPCQRFTDVTTCSLGGDNITLNRGGNSPAPLPTKQGVTVQSLTVAPNPTTGRIEVSVPTALHGAALPYTLTNLLGATVQQGTLSAEHATVDLTACKPGVYLLQTQSGKQIYRTKIVKY